MTNRLVRIVLIGAVLLSLALNAVVLAGGLRVVSLMREVGAQEAMLPAPWRRPYRQAVRADAEAMATLRAIVEARADMVAALRADPPDRAAADAASARVRALTDRFQARAYALLADRVVPERPAPAP